MRHSSISKFEVGELVKFPKDPVSVVIPVFFRNGAWIPVNLREGYWPVSGALAVVVDTNVRLNPGADPRADILVVPYNGDLVWIFDDEVLSC